MPAYGYRPFGANNYLTTRSIRLLTLAFGAATALIYVFTLQGLSLEVAHTPEIDVEASYTGPLPPVPFQDYHDREYDLVTQDPEMDAQKYLYVANYNSIQGFGNALQEYILNGYLAYSTNRTLVANNFTSFKYHSEEWIRAKYYHFRPYPAHVPWSALLTGRLFVDPVASPEPANPLYRPLGVRRFNEYCPSPVLINTNPMHMKIQDWFPQKRLEAWQGVFKTNYTEERCVQIHPNASRVFGFDCLHSKFILDLWPGLQKSGLLKNFGFSDLIMAAFKRNKALFMNTRTKWHHVIKWASTDYNLGRQTTLIPDLMVVHVRHGDWVKHCSGVKFHWGFQGFNRFKDFPDEPEDFRDGDNLNAERTERKYQRCFPSNEAMMKKIAEVRTPEITHLYLMTNADHVWIRNFTETLRETQQWDKVSSSTDVAMAREESYFGQVLDTYVGRRANVFIGNGWSSLTSNVALLRMHDGHANTTRFW